MSKSPSSLDRERHLRYWQRCWRTFLPTQYTSYDSTRMTLLFFIASAFDLLSPPADSSGEQPLNREDRAKIRAWVLSLQHPAGGFCGSPTHAALNTNNSSTPKAGAPNIASTCFALLLLALSAEGDGIDAFESVNRKATLQWLRTLQRSDGSFGEVIMDTGRIAGGRDMRYCYLASMIRWCLRTDSVEGEQDLVEDIDVDGLIEHIRQGQTYDGGMAESSQHEAHAGYAYCAIGALYLLDRPAQGNTFHKSETLRRGVSDTEALIKSLVSRQFAFLEGKTGDDEDDEDEDMETANFKLPESLQDLSLEENQEIVGYNGRCNKVADTCYCWWVAGTLSMVTSEDLLAVDPSRNFLLAKTQHLIGGFSKYPGGPPDVYHGYFGLAALATMGDSTLKQLDPALCISTDAVRKIENARKGLLASEKASETWTQRSSSGDFWAGKEASWPKSKADDERKNKLAAALQSLA